MSAFKKVKLVGARRYSNKGTVYERGKLYTVPAERAEVLLRQKNPQSPFLPYFREVTDRDVQALKERSVRRPEPKPEPKPEEIKVSLPSQATEEGVEDDPEFADSEGRGDLKSADVDPNSEEGGIVV